MNRTHIRWVWILVLANVAFNAAMYSRLPDPAPTHWNIHGEVDGWGPRWLAVGLFPLIMAGIMLLLVVLPRLGPFRANLESIAVTYGRIVVTVGLLMLTLNVIFILAAAGYKLPIGSSIALAIGLFFALLGNWMGKIPRNLYLGIRTPWTIANDTVWERTHRLGGRVMVAAGLIVAITALFASDITCFIVLMSSLGVTVIWAVVYSYRLYRRLGSVDDLHAPGSMGS